MIEVRKLEAGARLNVGVTGATGFVGRELCVRLANAGHRVIRLVRSERLSADDVLVGDLATVDCRQIRMPQLDVLIHLAARTHVVRERGTEIAEIDAAYRAANIDATENAVILAETSGVRRFIHLSSIKVNGESTPSGVAFRADDTPAPLDSYGRSKCKAEELVRRVCPGSGMEFAVLRPPLVYGPSVGGNLRLLYRLAGSRMPLPFASVGNRRSMIYVANLADLIATCLTHPNAANATMIAADGTVLSTDDLVRRMAIAQGREACLFRADPILVRRLAAILGRQDQVDRLFGNLVVDHDTVRKQLDWVPPTEPAVALSSTLATWHR